MPPIDPPEIPQTTEGSPAATWEQRDSLVPWDRNPRTKHDVDGIAESIRQLGWGAPLVCRVGSRQIVLGHGRWEAAGLLGLDLVPVRWVDLTDQQAAQLALADNRLSQRGEDDETMLRELLTEIGGAPGFDEQDWAADEAELRQALQEPDLTPVKDEFWIIVRGPMAVEPEVVAQVMDVCQGLEVMTGQIRR